MDKKPSLADLKKQLAVRGLKPIDYKDLPYDALVKLAQGAK